MTKRLLGLLRTLGPVRIVEDPEQDLTGSATCLVLSGSSRCISRGEVHVPAVRAVREARSRGIPVMGICYGFQLLAHMYGHPVTRLPVMVREVRTVEGVGEVMFHHGDGVSNLADMHVFSEGIEGTQFHPESTEDGVAWLTARVRRWTLRERGGT